MQIHSFSKGEWRSEYSRKSHLSWHLKGWKKKSSEKCFPGNVSLTGGWYINGFCHLVKTLHYYSFDFLSNLLNVVLLVDKKVDTWR